MLKKDFLKHPYWNIEKLQEWHHNQHAVTLKCNSTA